MKGGGYGYNAAEALEVDPVSGFPFRSPHTVRSRLDIDTDGRTL